MVQAATSSTFSRKIVNLFAGMAFGSPDLPHQFRSAGYYCHAIEPSFATSQQKLVNPEIMLCSDQQAHTLIIEAKSGANLKPDQLERYGLVTPEALVQRAFTSTSAGTSHNVLIIGRAEYKDRLLMGSALHPSTNRVLAVALGIANVGTAPLGDGSGAEQESEEATKLESIEPVTEESDAGASGVLIVENGFVDIKLQEAFTPLLEVDWDLIPNGFLPVDHESKDWEFAEFIFPEIIAAILDGNASIEVQNLATSFIRNWNFIATPYKKTLTARITTVIKLAAQQRFSPYLIYGQKGASKNIVTIKVPDKLKENASHVRTQLQRRFRELMDDLNSPQTAIIYEDEPTPQ